MELILASRNAHKLHEVQRVLAPFGLTVAPLPEHVQLPPEDGATFQDNALVKACSASDVLKRAVIADDSGIESDALNGWPGVRSARFAGEHATDAENLAKLLVQAPAGSALRYVCALAFVGPWPRPAGENALDAAAWVPPAHAQHQLFHGECAGLLAAVPRGENGFGYDPAFVPNKGPVGLTMAELDDDAKDAISHRGHALRAFARWFTSERLRPT